MFTGETSPYGLAASMTILKTDLIDKDSIFHGDYTRLERNRVTLHAIHSDEESDSRNATWSFGGRRV